MTTSHQLSHLHFSGCPYRPFSKWLYISPLDTLLILLHLMTHSSPKVKMSSYKCKLAQCLLIHTPEHNFKALTDLDTNYIHLIPCAYLYPGVLTFFCSLSQLRLSLPPRCGSWSLSLQSSPSDPQSLTPSYHSDYAQMLFFQKNLPFLSPLPNIPPTLVPAPYPITLNHSGLAKVQKKTTFKGHGLITSMV